MSYLRAYQAYQQRNYDQCLKLLQEVKQNDIKNLDLQAQVHFQRKEFQRAYDIYQSLLDRNDEFTQERRENILTIIACAQLEQPDTLKTRPKDKLPTVKEIVEQVEVINIKDGTVSDLSVKQEPQKKRRKNKKRKKRLPKQYDPVAGPDPERWLPRRDRKGNAHKQKKRRQRPPIKGKVTKSKPR